MIRIESNHPLLQLSSQVQEASHNFLKVHGLNYFQYLRCYKDGSVSLLVTDPSLFLRMVHLDTPLIFSSFKEEHSKQQSYWFSWDEELPHELVKLVKHDRNWHHGLTLVKREKDYYDMIAVAMPEERNNAHSYYINRISAIEHFMTHFQNHAPNIFKCITKSAILLPEVNRDLNYQNLCLKSKSRLPFGDSYLTSQELKCLKLKLEGNSYKEIANSCQLSPRTVETYLNRIKIRSGINDKSHLKELVELCK